jgi:hypothetical protein
MNHTKGTLAIAAAIVGLTLLVVAATTISSVERYVFAQKRHRVIAGPTVTTCTQSADNSQQEILLPSGGPTANTVTNDPSANTVTNDPSHTDSFSCNSGSRGTG